MGPCSPCRWWRHRRAMPATPRCFKKTDGGAQLRPVTHNELHFGSAWQPHRDASDGRPRPAPGSETRACTVGLSKDAAGLCVGGFRPPSEPKRSVFGAARLCKGVRSLRAGGKMSFRDRLGFPSFLGKYCRFASRDASVETVGRQHRVVARSGAARRDVDAVPAEGRFLRRMGDFCPFKGSAVPPPQNECWWPLGQTSRRRSTYYHFRPVPRCWEGSLLLHGFSMRALHAFCSP
jgi:hypothetical protein